ncbi:MAG: cupin domain-containing protein [Thermodesulfobacteriota bacterium]|nr:cupin domain-containing protein [Thermodesulfobacteriota bacterium]
MKVIRSTALQYIPASHEDPISPGVLKKVLLRKEDLIEGRVQMINWALLPVGKAFRSHYHQDMEEVFIVIHGNAKITVGKEQAKIGPGDVVVIPVGTVHKMENTGKENLEYLVMGVSLGQKGKTVTVRPP